jgi:hypothetical protein
VVDEQNTFILDEIAFEPNTAALEKRLRIKPGSPYVRELQQLVDAAINFAKPKVIYRAALINEKNEDTVIIDGITFSSRVLAVNLAQAHRVFAYVATCGAELGAWAHSIEDMVMSFWAEAIKEEALRAATVTMNKHLNACYDLGKTATMNPGSLPDWPIQQQRPLFQLLGNPHSVIGVELTESYLMEPNKSVSGIRFPTEERFESCMLCPRQDCPGRRSAYNPELYDKKYRTN